MMPIIGLVVLLGMVFGGYLLAGGSMTIIMKALPFEMMMIGGAAIGAFIIANGGEVLKGAGKGLGMVMKGPKYKKKDYLQLLSCLNHLLKIAKTRGMLALEAHIERPHESDIFAQYPVVMKDHFALDLICDALRTASMGMDDPHALDEMMERAIKKHHKEAAMCADALQTMSDGLPALGIVAAVLGVIKTMAHINEPPATLGKMIGGALVGTFLGVFLSYGMVGPMTARLRQIIERDGQFYHAIKDAIVAHFKGSAPPIAVELARGAVPTVVQPTFAEAEEAMSAAAA